MKILIKYIILFAFISKLCFAVDLNLKEEFIYAQKYQANLIYQIKPNSKKAILYIHGFNDYFFNKEFAQRFLEQGYSFFAIDLHNYGKNINKNTQKYYFSDIKEFFPEINKAVDIIKNRYKIENLTIYGLSQGGLIATLYENDYKRANQLILDSPFFDFNFNWFLENLALPIIAKTGSFFPNIELSSKEVNVFGKTIHKDFEGEWDIDMNLKNITTNAPIYLGWINAIHKAQQILQEGLNIKIPSLILYSHKSTPEDIDNEDRHSSDIVLDVDDIVKYSNMLSNDKSLIHREKIDNAIHGVLLSALPIREKAYKKTFKWLNTK